MKQFAILIFMLMSYRTMSLTTSTVECHYNNGNDSIAFTTVDNKYQTTRHMRDTKIKVSVVNINKLSEVDDFISITKDDKTITFSLNCKKL